MRKAAKDVMLKSFITQGTKFVFFFMDAGTRLPLIKLLILISGYFLSIFQVLKGLSYLREKHQIMHRGKWQRHWSSNCCDWFLQFHDNARKKLKHTKNPAIIESSITKSKGFISCFSPFLFLFRHMVFKYHFQKWQNTIQVWYL